MKQYIPVEGNPGLARDSKTGAIININIDEMEQARSRKELRRQKQDELENLKSQVQQMNNDLSEIKELLNRLVN